MDETNVTTQDSSPEKETPPGGSEGTTPQAEAKTYTEEEYQKALQADRIQRGRDAKSFELKEKSLTEKEEAINRRQAELDEQEKQREDAEFEAIRNNPEAVDWYNKNKALKEERKALQKERENVEREKAEHTAELEAAREAQREINIWQVATAKGIDPMRLKTLSEKFNVEGKEKLGELADEIASGKSEPSKTSHDSLVTSGGKQDHSSIRFDKEAPSATEMISKGLSKK